MPRYIHRRKPRRSRPEQGFPSKDLIGIRAQRIRAIMGLMATGQWAGKLTEIALAREWDLSLDYVMGLASQASAQLQLTVTTDFATTLRSRMLASTEAAKAKLAEILHDESRHGSYDRYEASEDGETWHEVPRKTALEEEFRASHKIRRIPCAPVSALPQFVQTMIRADEAVDRILSALPVERGDGEAMGPGERPGFNLSISYTLLPTDPKPGDGSAPPAPPAPPA